MLALIEKVADSARQGGKARIVVKMNALTDQPLINALLLAGQAGASIDLIVRGACTLPPGVPGVSENIRVISVVGRFLEHSRVTYFCWGKGEDDCSLMLSSADWMGRNMFRRVEVAWPVRDPVLRQRVIDEVLVPCLHDRMDAWQMQPDGSYKRVDDTGPSAQQALIQRLEAPRPLIRPIGN